MSTLHEVVEAIRELPSTVERGGGFEELTLRFLTLDPTMKSRYERVWRWAEWPDRDGADAGIDLVARDRDGGLTAVQCKFYGPDHTLAKADIDSFFTASGKRGFTNRIIVTSTDLWSSNAERALADQQIGVQRISLAEMAASPIDWRFETGTGGAGLRIDVDLAPKHQPRPHQQTAIEDVLAGWRTHDRGKLIMACGTGKTFTALKLVEQVAAGNAGRARVLFCVPSISLIGQTLREWTAQAALPIEAAVVCSDSKVHRAVEDITAHDLPLPATTDPAALAARASAGFDGLQVVFTTYQSLPVVAAAQQRGLPEFDVVIADEAHRTTGVTLAGEDDSNFVRIHDNGFIRAAKRLYMTATPRVFNETVKGKAEEHSAIVASMDDEDLFGPEFHRLPFGEAVDAGLLTDYKVLVLTVDEDHIAGPLQGQIADENHEINLDDATKIVGCWNGLAKRAGTDLAGHGFNPGEAPMRRAVAFARDINRSKAFARAFTDVQDAYDGIDENVLDCEVHHVDGTMNALTRGAELNWLKAPVADGDCRILTNARCLSEGVDVPALDAVMFLNPRNSIVDVVQSVGRVMRKADGKDYGYIILPIGVPSGLEPEQALADNKRFKVVWEVLNALRSHDDRFDAMVNSIDFNRGATNPAGRGANQLMGGHVGPVSDDPESLTRDGQTRAGETSTAATVNRQMGLFSLADWRDAIYARIVARVGTRAYWEDWARDVADMSTRQQARIRALVTDGDTAIQQAFAEFTDALRANLNDAVTEADAISMLSQHLITRPVFEALFEGYSFAARNPVSIVMQDMLDLLDGRGLDTETRDLDAFYDSVRVRAAGVTTAAGKQQVVTELYERFFKLAFAKQADALGIVYTPIEIVDWLIRAADDVLKAEFGRSITSEGVHILDGFTGTGTFIVRLLQSGAITPADLARKYATELHANEIMLLAYYIAAVNIEAAYHGITGGDYTPFEGISLTDTFQISEAGDRVDTSLFPQNNDRITRQLATDITVILGNPPYSVGQGSANDDNANLAYPTLDGRVAATYAARSTAVLKNSLYDSYIRAIRWATDRIGDSGVVAFVTNGGWIDSNTADGLRLTLADELTSLHVFNLRGNQRTAGEESRREGGKVFGAGSRNTVAMLVAVKNPAHAGDFQLRYHDVGDYLTREQKLKAVADSTLASTDWQTITPNAAGDWINQRNDTFTTYPAIGDKKPTPGQTAVFAKHSGGLKTNRDAWAYNYSHSELEANVRRMIDTYNDQVGAVAAGGGLDQDTTKISWSSSLTPKALKGTKIAYDPDGLRLSTYRPFSRQHAYFDSDLNDRQGQLPSMFPTPHHTNTGFYVVGAGSDKPFSTLMLDHLPDLAFWGSSNGQFFPRWTYEKVQAGEGQLDFGATDEGVDEWGYRRVDNITDAIHTVYRREFGPQVTKDDIFAYVYALLHSPQYRTAFAADLKKMLPRIPQPQDQATFDAYVDAGRRLADLHTGYETVDPYPLMPVYARNAPTDNRDLYRVTKMRWRSKTDKTDKTALVYNPWLTLTEIPDTAHEYLLGSRTALDWLIDRYQVKTDKASGIVNDPNDWCDEHHQPDYIVDLISRITTVSVETVKIVQSLPELDLDEGGT